MADVNPAPDEPRFPCKVCGRKFVRASLEKHEGACKKEKTKKRKVFDSGRQRASGGTDVTITSVRKAQKELARNEGAFRPPETKWRERHEQFQEGIKAAKNVDFALKTGSPLPPPPRSKIPSDYVECDFCGRNFSQKAAERHIPFCEKQSMKNNKHPPRVEPRSRSQPPKPLKPTHPGGGRQRTNDHVNSRRQRRSPSPPPSPPRRRRGNSFDRGFSDRRGETYDDDWTEPRRNMRTKLPQPTHVRRQSPANRMLRNPGRRY